jgi:hypothetical protein
MAGQKSEDQKYNGQFLLSLPGFQRDSNKFTNETT